MSDTIIAIDLGRYKSVACVLCSCVLRPRFHHRRAKELGFTVTKITDPASPSLEPPTASTP